MSATPLQTMASAQSHEPEQSTPAPTYRAPNFAKPCAIFLDGSEGPILGGKSLGVPSEIESRVLLVGNVDADPWMGLSLWFPLGQGNEAEGFGTCYRPIPRQLGMTMPTEMRRISPTPYKSRTPISRAR
ncbi:hypothetical protein FDECE_18536 [Fusarium decemcellulare]|nr:hypothetical protein FDECE_18536 [Fusarium decemcellulare]